MRIKRTERFNDELKEILSYIRKDSKEASIRFKNNLFNKIFSLVDTPYKYRQSKKSNDENVRDLIYEGYVIPYRIKEDAIEVLGIFSFNEWDMQ